MDSCGTPHKRLPRARAAEVIIALYNTYTRNTAPTIAGLYIRLTESVRPVIFLHPVNNSLLIKGNRVTNVLIANWKRYKGR